MVLNTGRVVGDAAGAGALASLLSYYQREATVKEFIWTTPASNKPLVTERSHLTGVFSGDICYLFVGTLDRQTS